MYIYIYIYIRATSTSIGLNPHELPLFMVPGMRYYVTLFLRPPILLSHSESNYGNKYFLRYIIPFTVSSNRLDTIIFLFLFTVLDSIKGCSSGVDYRCG